MKWKEISVLTEGLCVEAVAGVFHQMGSKGVVIEDPQAARKYINKNGWNNELVSPDFFEHEFIVVKAYFPANQDLLNEIYAAVSKVEAIFNSKCRVYVDEVLDEDWEDNWKKYYHTFKVSDRLVVKPSWEQYQPNPGEVVIDINPGMAFGTGIHASTRFCLKFIDQYLKGKETVVDAGCGSGILSIAAVKLGAAAVLAMDIDEVAVKVARENIELNYLQEKITVKSGDILSAMAGLNPDMVLANITAEVVVQLIPAAAKQITAGGYLFGSGIVESRWPLVKKTLEQYGFKIEQILTDVDWVGVAARKI